MNTEQKENIRKWVEALRSGEYKQGQGFLCRQGRYCCLGVACETQKVESIEHLNGKSYFFPEEKRIVPEETWFLLTFGFDFCSVDGLSLLYLNDSMGYTFDKIADLLEKTFLADETNNQQNK